MHDLAYDIYLADSIVDDLGDAFDRDPISVAANAQEIEALFAKIARLTSAVRLAKTLEAA